MESVRNFSNGRFFPGKTKSLSPCGADSRSDLSYCDCVFVRDSVPYFFCIVTLSQSTNRTVGDALSAKRTVCLLDLSSAGYIDGRARAGTLEIPDVQVLNLVTDLDTAHTLDTFCGIPYEREVFIPWLAFQTLAKRKVKDIQIVCDFLE